MTPEIITIPCLSNNYAFLLHSNGITALIDVPEAAPVLKALKEKGWSLDMVLLTHHHPDHIDGLAGLMAAYAPKIVGAAKDAHRLPKLDIALNEGDEITVGGLAGRVMDVSGHTVNHIAYAFEGAVFTGDSLFALGCGRVFEGTMEMMHESLQKLAALPPDTMVYSGHEYTLANAAFSLTIEPDNAALLARVKDVERLRAAGIPTVPSLLSLELATNPFLRAKDAAEFASIRTAKDNF
ncbi:MAG TPA: hydroxyacylglutathione hydrolase [Rhodobacteraceae bacterium]|nr:hydroxyacylglutathione hydrolase [Paracoccaceae bacterium]